MKQSYLRIVDANFNRAKEGLRVAEDCARFLMNDPQLTRRFKRARHDLTDLLMQLPVPYKRLVANRNSMADVGRQTWIQDGKKRPGWKDVMIANMKRSQESTRVLEEMTKIISPRHVQKLQKIRFRLYELEKICFRKF